MLFSLLFWTVLYQVSLVLVEPRKHHNFNKQNFFRRHSYM